MNIILLLPFPFFFFFFPFVLFGFYFHPFRGNASWRLDFLWQRHWWKVVILFEDSWKKTVWSRANCTKSSQSITVFQEKIWCTRYFYLLKSHCDSCYHVMNMAGETSLGDTKQSVARKLPSSCHPFTCEFLRFAEFWSVWCCLAFLCTSWVMEYMYSVTFPGDTFSLRTC